MKNVELIGTKRELKGTTGAQQLRRSKLVPCVLYGGKEVVHFSVEERALGKIVNSPLAHHVELVIDGEKHPAVLQDKQFQPVTDALIHVDFMVAAPDQEVRMGLIVRATGQSAGVRKGGKLNQAMRKVRVKGMPAAVPEVLELDVTGMDMGDSIRVQDIKLPGLTMLDKPNEVILAVKAVKKAAEAAVTPAAGAAAPAEKKAEPAKK
ncbi:MAG: 50S ribosomal protein L25 [Flavobacteriales bacterium]|nr:50S ribosomal protein L25 [Flavobacteriales bacterium]MBP9079090.1 50S ribosomal protein L25 [Flavobacteriales bacterium]